MNSLKIYDLSSLASGFQALKEDEISLYSLKTSGLTFNREISKLAIEKTFFQ